MIQDMKRLEEGILRNESIVQSFDTQEWKAVPSPPLYVFLRGGVCAPLLQQEKIALTCYKSCSISLTRSNILSSSEKTNVECLTPWLKYKHRKKCVLNYII